MRALILPALLLAVVGCGSDGTTEPTALGPIRLTVITGDAQSDTIQALLGTPIRVQAVRVDPVTLVTTPAANQIVNFVAVELGCGRAFAGSAITDVNGNATDRWELGTKTGLCHMEVRTVDQLTGQPVVFATAAATINPGAVDTLAVYDARVLFLSSRISMRSMVYQSTDRLGNRVVNPALVLEAPPGWGAAADSLFAPTNETSTQQLVVRSGLRSAAMGITAVRDLRLNNWTTSLKCLPHDAFNAAGTLRVDSVSVPLVTVDRVFYSKDTYVDNAINPSNTTYFEWSGVATLYLVDNTTETRQLTNMQRRFDQYSPGTISFPEGSPSFTQTSANPLGYSGDRKAWCSAGGWEELRDSQSSPRMMTLTATP